VASKPETTFLKHIKPILEAIPYSYWIKIAQVSLRGCPDLYGVINGHAVLLELKKDSKSKPSALQEWHLKRAAQAGALALVVYPENFDDSYRLLADLSCIDEESDEELVTLN